MKAYPKPVIESVWRRLSKGGVKKGLNSLNNGSQNLPILPTKKLGNITSREIKALDAKLDSVLEFKVHDLGETYDVAAPYPQAETEVPKKHYPSLYISGKHEPLDLPEEGHAKVHYKVRRSSMHNNDGKVEHSHDIEIHSIEPIEEEEKSKEGQRAKFLPEASLKLTTSLPSPDRAFRNPSRLIQFKNKSGIHIKKENEGKFTATKEKTGKSTAELAKSKNPLTRKRAIFAQNAKKWHHGKKKKNMSDTSKAIEFGPGDQIKRLVKSHLGKDYSIPNSAVDAILKKDIKGFKKATRSQVDSLIRDDPPPSRKAFREGMAHYGVKPTRAGFMGQMRDISSDAARVMRNTPKHVIAGLREHDLLEGALKHRGIDVPIMSSLFSISKKLDNIIEFAGGYVNTGIGVRKEKGVGGHFNRNAGKYISLPFAAPTLGVGLAGGALIDHLRKKKSIEKTKSENPVNPDLAKGHVYSVIDKLDRLIQLDSRPRDSMGQFQNQEEGAPDPNAMAKVYHEGLAEGGGAAAAGAAALPLTKALLARVAKAKAK